MPTQQVLLVVQVVLVAGELVLEQAMLLAEPQTLVAAVEVEQLLQIKMEQVVVLALYL